MFYRTGVIADRILHCGNRDFRSFCFCDLELDQIIFIYELDQYSLEIYKMCKYELPTSMPSKVIVWQKDRQTDRQTDTTETIYHAASFSKNEGSFIFV